MGPLKGDLSPSPPRLEPHTPEPVPFTATDPVPRVRRGAFDGGSLCEARVGRGLGSEAESGGGCSVLALFLKEASRQVQSTFQ